MSKDTEKALAKRQAERAKENKGREPARTQAARRPSPAKES